MPRSERYFRSLITGYGATVITSLCVLASVPLALSFISTASFAIWGLIVQVSGYLLLGDLGVSSAVGRLLMNHLQSRPSMQYGQIFFAGLISFVGQAFVVFAIGIGFAFFGPTILDIPADMRSDFTRLMICQTSIISVFFPLKTVTYAFVAQGRYEWINVSTALGTIVSLLTLFIGFTLGLGLGAYIVAALTESVLICSIQIVMAAKSGLLPKKREYFFPAKQQILAVWEIGWDIFLVGLGNRLFYTSQSFLLARFAGLDSVAAWIIGSKLFYFGREMLSKAAFMAGPPLMSLYVEGLRAKAELRLSQITKVLGYCAAILGGFLIAGNSAFVELWSGGKVFWPKTSNIALAALLVCNAFSFSLIHLLGMELRFKALRYITHLEAAFFILSSFYFVPRLGLSSVAPLMLFSTLLFSMPYLFYSYIRCCRQWQTSRTLRISFVLRLILLLCFASFCSLLLSESHLSFSAIVSIFVFLSVGLYFIWLDLRNEFAFLKTHFFSAFAK